MNWASSSAIDVLRLGLTGGDRIVDTASLTVLQRAVLPDGRFYNDNNFPSKRLSAALVNGALPSALRGTYTGDVYVANCFNRIHFGTAATGGCDDPGDNSNLGIAADQAIGLSRPLRVCRQASHKPVRHAGRHAAFPEHLKLHMGAVPTGRLRPSSTVFYAATLFSRMAPPTAVQRAT